MRSCRALDGLRIASIHDIGFILDRECGVCECARKSREDGQELQLTIEAVYQSNHACLYIGLKGPVEVRCL